MILYTGNCEDLGLHIFEEAGTQGHKVTEHIKANIYEPENAMRARNITKSWVGIGKFVLCILCRYHCIRHCDPAISRTALGAWHLCFRGPISCMSEERVGGGSLHTRMLCLKARIGNDTLPSTASPY